MSPIAVNRRWWVEEAMAKLPAPTAIGPEVSIVDLRGFEAAHTTLLWNLKDGADRQISICNCARAPWRNSLREE